jgi:hypothetical protein
MPHTSLPGHRLLMIIKKWHTQLASVFNPYRPELHYMRGPGPRWHARHGAVAASLARLNQGAGR